MSVFGHFVCQWNVRRTSCRSYPNFACRRMAVSCCFAELLYKSSCVFCFTSYFYFSVCTCALGNTRHYLPPVVNTPDVQLEIQLDRPLRPVVERLKAISPVIYLDGCMSGELILRIDNDAVSVRTFYDKLIPRVDEESTQPQDPARCTLKIDSKKLLASLQWQSSMAKGSISSYIICMIENEMMVVHVVLQPEDVGFFTYYIPVHFLSDMESH